MSRRKNAAKLSRINAELASVQRSIPSREADHTALASIMQLVERLQLKMMKEDRPR